jgi:hypothetical protein
VKDKVNIDRLLVIAGMAISVLTMLFTFTNDTSKRLCRIEAVMKVGECKP